MNAACFLKFIYQKKMNITDIVLVVQLFIEFLNLIRWCDPVNCFVGFVLIFWVEILCSTQWFVWVKIFSPAIRIYAPWGLKKRVCENAEPNWLIIASLSSLIAAFLSKLCLIRGVTIYFFLCFHVSCCLFSSSLFFWWLQCTIQLFSYLFHSIWLGEEFWPL